jgi:hypothetical protein
MDSVALAGCACGFGFSQQQDWKEAGVAKYSSIIEK